MPSRPPPSPSSPIGVALDVGPLHGHRTGVGVAASHLADELGRRDDVRVVPYLVSFRARPVAGERRLPVPAGAAMRAWSRLDHPRAGRWFGRWVRDVDVVHGTNYVAPPSDRPTVISVYDCWFLAHPELASTAVRRAGAVLRRAARRGARIHVSSHATARVAGELLDTDRVSVVHLGPPHPLAAASGSTSRPGRTPAMVAGRPFVVAIGTTERRKGVPALVEAFGRVAAAQGDLHLVVAGAPGDDQEAVDRAVAALPGERRERVHVLGPVDAPTRDALLADAVALAYPSLDEGFGFPILEAQQAGTPVVARPSGSIPEVGGCGVELAGDDSVDALTAAIERVVADDARRRDLVAAGRANLSRFSWERTASEMVAVYRTACEERS